MAKGIEVEDGQAARVDKKSDIDRSTRPRSADELEAWIYRWLEIDVARHAVVDGHSSPFDYIKWAFFDDDRVGTQTPGEAALEGEPEHSAEREASQDVEATGKSPDGVVWANRGGGKTLLGAVATLLDMHFKSGIEVRILAGSMEQASRMHEHLRRLLEREDMIDLVAGKITDRKIELVNGSRMELLAQSQTSVRGTRVQRLRCDEVELFDPAVWEAAQLTTRSKVCAGRLVRGSIECLSTMHVPHGLMHRMVVEAKEGKRRLFKWGVIDVLAKCGEERKCGGGSAACDGSASTSANGQTLALNPQHAAPSTQHVVPCALWADCGGRAKERRGNLSDEGIGHITIDDAIRMKGRVSQATWEAEMVCLRPRRDLTVFPEFVPAVHVVTDEQMAGLTNGRMGAAEEASRWPVTFVGGMDFGIRSPAVVLWAAYDGATGRLFVVDERVQTGRTVAEHARAILESPWPQLRWLGVDPSGNSLNDHTGTTSVAVLRAAGLKVKVNHAYVVPGIELVRARLRPADEATSGGPRLYVHARCVKLIESLEKYHYPVNEPTSLMPEKDGSDHAVDALRYMVQNLDGAAEAKSSFYAK